MIEPTPGQCRVPCRRATPRGVAAGHQLGPVRGAGGPGLRRAGAYQRHCPPTTTTPPAAGAASAAAATSTFGAVIAQRGSIRMKRKSTPSYSKPSIGARAAAINGVGRLTQARKPGNPARSSAGKKKQEAEPPRGAAPPLDGTGLRPRAGRQPRWRAASPLGKHPVLRGCRPAARDWKRMSALPGTGRQSGCRAEGGALTGSPGQPPGCGAQSHALASASGMHGRCSMTTVTPRRLAPDDVTDLIRVRVSLRRRRHRPQG